MEVDEDMDIGSTSGENSTSIADEPGTTKPSSHQMARYQKLGFHPQKEIHVNKYLPYADKLDDESQTMLTELKEYLARAVVHQEMTPAIGTAAAKLMV